VSAAVARRLPIGAEVVPGGVHFRVWAPARASVAVVERRNGSVAAAAEYPLEKEGGGYHSGFVRTFANGSLYSFRFDADDKLYPDPASRFQPEGVHGPSQVVDPAAYSWEDAGFRGPDRKTRVIYELHIGTFTAEGTYRAAEEQLATLRDLGVTTLELMPLSDFPGRFGWGYDGVDIYAPTRLYGPPNELRHFIDSAHRHGLAVILDVVYNHVGPDGNYLKAFSADYFTDRYENEWGEALNFDGEHAGPVREFFVTNARYWIEEYHFDGLRLDATQSIFDASEQHVIAELVAAARAAGHRADKNIYLVAENEPQVTRIVRPPTEGGYDCDALWNDDFHHTARVALTGQHEAYYEDYRGTPQELISALKWGYLFQGQYYDWQKKCRGTPALDLEAPKFVTYLQNHDQIANSASGARIHQLTSPGELRAMTALMLLAPPTPMLFQGQEFAASSPFLFFADHEPELAGLVKDGRKKFLHQFPSITHPRITSALADPAALHTFERCKLDFAEREKNRAIFDLHRDLLRLRHEDAVLSADAKVDLHGAVLGERAFLLRFFSAVGDRLLLVNLGTQLKLSPAPEPLLAAGPDNEWRLLWSSEDSRYGGNGFSKIWSGGRFDLPGRSAHFFAVAPCKNPEPELGGLEK
jgi:maltooligosyltrehalose trehalohydrolase